MRKDVPHERHPSWGLIHLGRWTSSHEQTFFGSPLRHRNGICLSVEQASRHRDLHRDWIFAEKKVFEVNMTEVQFGQLISSFNQGNETACTIHQIGSQRMPDCPAERLKEKVSTDVKEHFQEARKLVDEAVTQATQLREKTSATKKERKDLEDTLKHLKAMLDGNLDFLKRSFVRDMERVVTEAKAELQAHASRIVIATGVKGLKANLPELNP